MTFSKLMRFLTWLFKAANHDFCPNLNRFVYWLKKPIGWVISAALFSTLVGIFVGPQGYVLTFAFVALLILGLAWPWLSMKGIRCSLAVPHGVMKENEAGEFTLGIRNYWPIPVFGLIIEGDFLQGLDEEEAPIAFSLKRVPAFSKAEFPVSITPRRRGTMPAGEVRISNGFPFGIAYVSLPISDIDAALVWPQCESLQGNPPSEGNVFSIAGALVDRSGNDGETIGIRNFRDGDRLRNVHWAQTVRSQRLMVRERQTHSSTISTVLVDLSPDHHSGIGVDSSFEWAIRIAASVCLQLHRTNSSFRVACLGLPKKTLNRIESLRGIDCVMEFFAGLPTLKMQQAIPEHELAISHKNWSLACQTFFVCTTESAIDKLSNENIEPIVIDLSGFRGSEDESLFANESTERPRVWSTASSPNKKGSFAISSPQHAASELELAWRRSFGHASN